MRMNYEVSDEIHRRAKLAAVSKGMTLKGFLEQALDEAASKVERAEERKTARKAAR